MPGVPSEFLVAVKEVAEGASMLRRVCEDSQDNQLYVDPNEPFARISGPAFCLRLAMQIWDATRRGPAVLGPGGVFVAPPFGGAACSPGMQAQMQALGELPAFSTSAASTGFTIGDAADLESFLRNHFSADMLAALHARLTPPPPQPPPPPGKEAP